MRKLITAVAMMTSTWCFADAFQRGQQQQQQQKWQRCQPSKVWLLVSTEYGGEIPLGGLKYFDERYHNMFRDLGYSTEEIHRSQLYTEAKPCDLVVEVKMTYLKAMNRCKINSWLEEVKSNSGTSEMDVYLNLHAASSTQTQMSLLKENSCALAMERSLKEILPAARATVEAGSPIYQEPLRSANLVEGCKSSKVWMLVSPDRNKQDKRYGLKKWPKRYIEKFQRYGYEPEVIDRSILHAKASVCDLVLDAEFEHGSFGSVMAYAWLHTVSANDGQNEDSVVRSLVKLGFSPSLPLGIHKKWALREAFNEVFAPMKSTGGAKM